MVCKWPVSTAPTRLFIIFLFNCCPLPPISSFWKCLRDLFDIPRLLCTHENESFEHENYMLINGNCSHRLCFLDDSSLLPCWLPFSTTPGVWGFLRIEFLMANSGKPTNCTTNHSRILDGACLEICHDQHSWVKPLKRCTSLIYPLFVMYNSLLVKYGIQYQWM